MDYHERYAAILTDQQKAEIQAAKVAWEQGIALHGSHFESRAEVISHVRAAYFQRKADGCVSSTADRAS